MARALAIAATACLLAAPALGVVLERRIFTEDQTVSASTFASGQVRQWVRHNACPPNQIIPLVFAVRQDRELVEKIVTDVSHPKSANYGNHLSFDDMARFIDAEDVEAVHTFLNNYDVVERDATPHGEFIRVQVRASVANEMLDTTFFNFEHEETGRQIQRAAGYSLPIALSNVVSFVGYVTTFPNPNLKPEFVTISPEAAGATGVATPAVIDQTYNIKNNTVATTRASQAVFETIGQSYEPSDLTAFDTQNNVPPQKVAKVIGPNSPSSCASNPNNCVEAELDIQQISAIAQGTHNTFWSIPGTESFLDWAQAVAAATNPPLVHSISYGEPESDGSATQQKAFDTELAKLGTRGISVFIASGDDGVAGSSARGNSGACGFNPSYPATAPHATAVGATQGPESGGPEVACSSSTGGGITTGGGFSNVFTQPTWQKTVVENYLNNGPNMPPSSKFNGAGRGYPDVGALGHNYVIVVNGQSYQGSGTSASTPVFAAMVSLINGMRLEAGKSSLGFLNPALYGLDESVFNQITSGENNCAAGAQGSATCCQYGFTATKGWTPLDGRGSPKFDKLQSALMSL